MEKLRRGRPPKKPEDRVGGAIHFRVRGDYRSELEKAALLSGRSLSEECEFRLNRSIQREAALAEMFGSPEHQTLLLAIGNVVRLADTWSDDGVDAVGQVRAAVIALIEGLAGERSRDILDEASKTGFGWQRAADNVLLLQKGELAAHRPLQEVMGR